MIIRLIGGGGGWSSSTYPNSRILIENFLAGKACWENDLSIAPMDLTGNTKGGSITVPLTSF